MAHPSLSSDYASWAEFQIELHSHGMVENSSLDRVHMQPRSISRRDMLHHTDDCNLEAGSCDFPDQCPIREVQDNHVAFGSFNSTEVNRLSVSEEVRPDNGSVHGRDPSSVVIAQNNTNCTSCPQHQFSHYSGNSEDALSARILMLEPCIYRDNTREPQERITTSRVRSNETSVSIRAVRSSSNRRDKSQFSQSFQLAVDLHDWHLAESLISFADLQRLNDGLCVVLDCVWFLGTQDEIYGAIRLMEKLVEAGAKDFTRAALRTSFLASCVSVFSQKSFNPSEMVSLFDERLYEKLQECSGHEQSKAEAAVKVRVFAEWALKYINSHSQIQKRNVNEQIVQNSSMESQLHLKAFKRFLELAGNRLTGNDYTEAFDAACFPLTLFSSVIDPGWASGIGSSAIQGMMGMLVEGGAYNVNQCCLEAARFGSTNLLRILLQIAQRNGIEVDVDLALEYASYFCKIRTMECLVEEWNASYFLGPLMRAADRGCLTVVRWFVEREYREMELCSALVASTSSNKFEVSEYLLKCIPLNVLNARSTDILRAIGDRNVGSLNGVNFLLHCNFLCTAEETYAAADNISKLDGDVVPAELKTFCKSHWSHEAFIKGCQAGEDHYLNVVRAVNFGSSSLRLQELPIELQVAIAYFPLYKECTATPGTLLSQWLRGQLVAAVLRLNTAHSLSTEDLLDKNKLLKMLKLRLPSFLIEKF